jgi:hypothetical protein
MHQLHHITGPSTPVPAPTLGQLAPPDKTKGTGWHPFAPTLVPDEECQPWEFVTISAMPEYSGKSVEELRVEDYSMGVKGAMLENWDHTKELSGRSTIPRRLSCSDMLRNKSAPLIGAASGRPQERSFHLDPVFEPKARSSNHNRPA